LLSRALCGKLEDGVGACEGVVCADVGAGESWTFISTKITREKAYFNAAYKKAYGTATENPIRIIDACSPPSCCTSCTTTDRRSSFDIIVKATNNVSGSGVFQIRGFEIVDVVFELC